MREACIFATAREARTQLIISNIAHNVHGRKLLKRGQRVPFIRAFFVHFVFYGMRAKRDRSRSAHANIYIEFFSERSCEKIVDER